ncbi:MAG: efflux RND transporter periplasmic adaptor subunit [Chitinophagaceae bacterium]|nr:efflux RND transporter periplasmic adaptor subunit [Chitinophagaceae bacterium]
MQNVFKHPVFWFTAIFMLLATSCGTGAKEKKASLNEKKMNLEKLKKEKIKLDAEIRRLEQEIAQADPSAAQQSFRLVAVDTVKAGDFTHYIELQGRINADEIAYVSPSGQGGVVKAIYVKPGQRVSKGQVLLKLDDAVAVQALQSARQRIGEINTRLSQAQTIYQRYKNLWDQNIGAEIQVINAKADVDALTAQLNSARAAVRQAQEVVNMSLVRAGISGIVEQVNVRVGEFFTGASPDGRGAQILIVNNSRLKAEIPVPDNYVSKVKKGDKVQVLVSETGKPPFETTISRVGETIDMTTRSFIAEAYLPYHPYLKPNQSALIKILDYEAKGAVTVPVNIVQSDEQNKYVFIAQQNGNKLIARKKIVIPGEVYGELMEIKSGLNAGDIIITEGYQNLYDGQAISVEK